MPVPRVRPLILAAGAGSRFGGSKLGARVDGKPILAHVIDAASTPGLERPVVVLGPGGTAGSAGEADLAGLDLGGTTIARNPAPERGLASSLLVGWEVATGRFPLEAAPPDAILVLLGDQPLVRPETIRALTELPLDPARPIAAARATGSTARNPVRIETSSALLLEEVQGDRGLGPVIDAHPELVRWVEVDGDNPDVDTVANLASVADLAWADRVRRNRDQVERLREEPDGQDFYAKVSSIFREDPDREGDPVLDALRGRARPGDTWLDIGAGAGRYAMPLARSVDRVIAIDPSQSMLDGLREGITEHEIGNIKIFEGRWPAVAEEGSGGLAELLPADVSLIAHVGYDIEAIWPFLEAMERATTRECLAVLMERSPASVAEPFWPPIHGESRISLPALPAFVDLLTAHGRSPEVRMLESSRRRWSSREEVEPFIRRQTWVKPGSEKDRRMQPLLDEWLVPASDGSYELSVAEPLRVGLVAWTPIERADPTA